jgi:hypothetical protein
MEITRRFARTTIAAMVLFAFAACGAGNVNPAAPDVASQPRNLGRPTCKPGFSLALTPTSGSISPGKSVRTTAELTSNCGLGGTIDVGIASISPQPAGNNGFSFTQSRYDVPLTPNGSTSAYITFGATATTLKTTYTIAISAKDISGCCRGLEQPASFSLTVK